jgi:hypothetical protein
MQTTETAPEVKEPVNPENGEQNAVKDKPKRKRTKPTEGAKEKPAAGSAPMYRVKTDADKQNDENKEEEGQQNTPEGEDLPKTA